MNFGTVSLASDGDRRSVDYSLSTGRSRPSIRANKSSKPALASQTSQCEKSPVETKKVVDQRISAAMLQNVSVKAIKAQGVSSEEIASARVL